MEKLSHDIDLTWDRMIRFMTLLVVRTATFLCAWKRGVNQCFTRIVLYIPQIMCVLGRTIDVRFSCLFFFVLAEYSHVRECRAPAQNKILILEYLLQQNYLRTFIKLPKIDHCFFDVIISLNIISIEFFKNSRLVQTFKYHLFSLDF